MGLSRALPSPAMDALNQRHREILRAIVLEHVSSGEPVGSAAIAGREVQASPATVRSVMADLEELGFLEKPHTSAGRIPTDRGYRYFVDTVVRTREPLPRDRALIEQQLTQEQGELTERLEQTSRMLDALSTHAGLVLTPRPAAALA